jgi:hypothetical protein
MATTKPQHIAAAALLLRVSARRAGKITDTMAWDAIAVYQTRNPACPALAARPVIRAARAEFAAYGENIPYTPDPK